MSGLNGEIMLFFFFVFFFKHSCFANFEIEVWCVQTSETFDNKGLHAKM